MVSYEENERRMKVLLLTPVGTYWVKRVTPPLGLLSVATLLEKEEHEVEIFDTYLHQATQSDLARKVRSFKGRVFGITSHVEDRLNAWETARLIKEVNPESFVMLGGPFPTICHREILEDWPCIDLVVRGEGDHTTLEVIKALERGNLNGIEGISYRDREGKIVVNPGRALIEDLNTLPFPAFHLVDFDRYPNYFESEGLYATSVASRIRHITRTASLIFGRGCPYQCVFCASVEMWGRRYRILTPENAVAQIGYFMERGINGFAFYDDHLLLNKKWFSRFVDLIKEKKYDIRCKLSARVDAINEDVGNQLVEIGCVLVTLGIESGSQRVLDIMDKGTTVKQIEDSLRILTERGIYAKGGMLFGFPGEGEREINESMSFIEEMEKKYFLNAGFPMPVQIHPGTELEKKAKEMPHYNFRWTSPYFNHKNLCLLSSPYTPLFLGDDRIAGILAYLARMIVELKLEKGFQRLISLYLLFPSRVFASLRERMLLRWLVFKGVCQALFHSFSENCRFIFQATALSGYRRWKKQG
jgi:radical SAM superfamily enzyme YgiQ (UPF0313 family)